MTQARIANFGCRFRDIITPASQKFRGAFHPEVAQILRNGEPNLARKDPAQVKWTATDFLAQHFQRWGMSQITRQQFLGPFYSVTGHALLPHTKEFRIFWFKEEMGHQLEGFAL